MENLKAVWQDFGQAIWLDYIERGMLTTGGLEQLVRDDGIRGVTSNPTIFCKAITGSIAYDAAVQTMLAADPQVATSRLYEELAITDIRLAADQLRSVFDASGGSDGFVSLEVSPHLAHDTAGTIDEARRLWQEVARPNLMIKVPATAAGVPAVETLIGEGINVNVTLVFSLADYEAVAGAYLRGLERCAAPDRVASVASFFISRVDSVVDAQLEARGSARALGLRGKAAIANARLAYRRFLEIFHGDAFKAPAGRGARVQRPLWASTSTKNPAYPDVLYVEDLIASETVNTLPTETLDAFRHHGTPRAGLEQGLDSAGEIMVDLAREGIDLDEVTTQLQIAGVASFAASFDDLIAALDHKRKMFVETR